MSDTDDVMGPVDIVVIGYPPGAPMTGEAVPHLIELVERGIIRVLDALFVLKNDDGTFSGVAAQDLDAERFGQFTEFSGATSGLLGDEDVATAAEGMEPGEAAAMIIYENRWAAPFAAAVVRNGGRLLAYERIPINELLAAAEASDPA